MENTVTGHLTALGRRLEVKKRQRCKLQQKLYKREREKNSTTKQRNKTTATTQNTEERPEVEREREREKWDIRKVGRTNLGTCK